MTMGVGQSGEVKAKVTQNIEVKVSNNTNMTTGVGQRGVVKGEVAENTERKVNVNAVTPSSSQNTHHLSNRMSDVTLEKTGSTLQRNTGKQTTALQNLENESENVIVNSIQGHGSDIIHDVFNSNSKDSEMLSETSDSSGRVTEETVVESECTVEPAVSLTESVVPLNSGPVCKLKRSNSKTSESGILEKKLWHAPPKEIFKPTIEAMEEYKMIEDGDRVLVCLSGGKDSLSLLHTMRQYQFYTRHKGVKFELGAVTVDPQTEAYDPSPLKDYLAKLGVPYFYEEQCIMESALTLPSGCTSICSYCSRMKRGRIYAAARREGYNVLALGQHLDDISESFLMSVFHNGILRTMKASYTVKEGDLRVIRPFVYVREKDLRNFSLEKKLPVIAENCPACFEAPKERHRVKQLLASQEVLHPRLFHSLGAALRPIMAINKTGVNATQILTGANGVVSEEKDIDEL